MVLTLFLFQQKLFRVEFDVEKQLRRSVIHIPHAGTHQLKVVHNFFSSPQKCRVRGSRVAPYQMSSGQQQKNWLHQMR